MATTGEGVARRKGQAGEGGIEKHREEGGGGGGGGAGRRYIKGPKRLIIPVYSVCPHELATMGDTEAELPPIDPEQMIVLKRAFDSFDSDKKGAISTDIVGTILRMMGQTVNRQILTQVIEEVDVDGSGELEFNEFVLLAVKFMNEEDEEELKKELYEAFRLYDKEGQGFIPTKVLREILHELDDKLTNEELDGIIDEIDQDGSGTVDFDEFMDMMTG
ncbi:troponin C, isotype gamma-like [Panulirus ornatus]|uniref:troponin C, isotype gamma-like n=1 Tax=Panulirus ornatus TaxID=150431 RepID=UPI003A86A74A